MMSFIGSKIVLENRLFLLTRDGLCPFPVIDINIQIKICHSICQYKYTYQFLNSSDKDLDAVFYFPFEASKTVTNIGVINGEIKFESKIDTGNKQYEFIRNNINDFLQLHLMKSEYQKNQITNPLLIEVGVVPANQRVIVEISLFEILQVQDQSYRLNISPVYIPKFNIESDNFIHLATLLQQILIEQSKVEKNSEPTKYFHIELIDQVSQLINQQKLQMQNFQSYSWNIEVSIENRADISQVESLNHLISYDFITETLGVIYIKEEDRHLIHSKDFILMIRDKNLKDFQVLSSCKDNCQAILLQSDDSWTELQETTSEQQEFLVYQDPGNTEYYFLLDRGETMKGPTFQLAIEILKYFLLNLPLGTKFNIAILGNGSSFMFPKTVEYNKTVYEESLLLLDDLTVIQGESGLSSSLENIYSILKSSSTDKKLFLFTDGGVTNPDEIVDLINKNSFQNQTLDIFGVGKKVFTEFIKYCAYYGYGRYFFVNDDKQIQQNVVEALRKQQPEYRVIGSLEFYDEENNTIDVKFSSFFDKIITRGKPFNLKLFLENQPKVVRSRISIMNAMTRKTKVLLIDIKFVEKIDQEIFHCCLSDYLSKLGNTYEIDLLRIKYSKDFQIINHSTRFLLQSQDKVLNVLYPWIGSPPAMRARVTIIFCFQKVLQIYLSPFDIARQFQEHIQDREGVMVDGQRVYTKYERLIDPNIRISEYCFDEEILFFHMILNSKKILQVVNYFGRVLEKYESKMLSYREILHLSPDKLLSSYPDLKEFSKRSKEYIRFEVSNFEQTKLFAPSTSINSLIDRYNIKVIRVREYLDIEFCLIKNQFNREIHRIDIHHQLELEKLLKSLDFIDFSAIQKIYFDNAEISREMWGKTFEELGIDNSKKFQITVKDYRMITQLQQGDGSWDQRVNQFIVLLSQEIQEEIKKISEMKESVFYTLLGIALLYQQGFGKQNGWILLEKKALTFLKRHGAIEEEQLVSLISNLKILD